jgi:hypothetical protein
MMRRNTEVADAFYCPSVTTPDPDGGPEGWGFRLQFTLLYPK